MATYFSHSTSNHFCHWDLSKNLFPHDYIAFSQLYEFISDNWPFGFAIHVILNLYSCTCNFISKYFQYCLLTSDAYYDNPILNFCYNCKLL